MMFKLAEAELDTMLVLWECEEPIRPSQLLIRVNQNGHTWSISTLQTLLSRLLAKGAVTVTSHKRFHNFTPAMSREEFLAATTKQMLSRLSTYSPVSFAESLLKGGLLTEADLKEAEKLLDAAK